jgi:omega-6 fatty acid desaturase (delta-12 desaturase)
MPASGLRDSYLVAGVWAASALATVILARATGQNALLQLICSMAVPFAIWNTSMGFIIYQQHTSPDIRWYDKMTDWRTANFAIDDTQRVVFPRPINTVFHNILEHHAHHFDPLISLHELPRAQAALETVLGARIRVVPWTLQSFLNATRICKLYDYTEHRWLDFTGRYTSDRIA